MEISYSLPKTNILNKIFIAIINKKITNLHLVNISKVVNVCRNGLYYHFDSYQDLIAEWGGLSLHSAIFAFQIEEPLRFLY